MDIVWRPTRDIIERANVTHFMRKHGIPTYPELLEKSRSDIEWFWRAVEEDLQLEWFTRYTNVLDTSKGIMWAKWFADGRINIAHNCVDRHARSWRRNKLALIHEAEDGHVTRLTFRDVAAQVAQCANALRALGVKKGDAVGIFMPLCPEAIIAMMAVLKIGAIYSPIFSGYGAPAVATRLVDCNAKVLFVVDGFFRRGGKVQLLPVVDEVRKLAPCVENVIVFGRLGERHAYLDWAALLGRQPRECATEPTGSEDPFLIIYTSGTTGRPKGSVHAHGGFLVKIAQEVRHQVDLHEDDILFWFTDMGWIMAPWEIVGGWANGGTIFTCEGAPDYPQPDRLWAMIERHGISILGVSPTLIRALLKYGDEPVTKHDLSSLRVFGSTGEPWNPEPYLWLLNVVGQGRCPIINLSGGTEVGACFLSPTPVCELKPCSLAGPALGMDVDVWDDQGRPVRDGRVGELVCKKPWPGMTRGLWKDPQRFIDVYWSRWPNVWVHGDWASVDSDGHWFLHGRSDDTIKIAGKRVGPAEVESALAGHPAVLESAAIGVPDDLKGEKIVCFVVLKPGHEPSDALRDSIREQGAKVLGKAMKPDVVRFVKLLPRTRNAKILRRVIRAAYLGSNDFGDLTNLENPEAITEITRSA